MAITTGSLDTPHDFCKGRAAAKDELKEIAEDPDDEEDGDGISADQEDNVFIAAGKALRFSGQWLTDNSVPDEIADYNENKQTPYEYVQDGLSNLSRTAISSMSSYERKVETWLLKQDQIADNFGNITTVYLQDIIKSWETWKKSPSNDKNRKDHNYGVIFVENLLILYQRQLLSKLLILNGIQMITTSIQKRYIKNQKAKKSTVYTIYSCFR